MLSTEQLLKQYSIRVSARAKYMRLTISLEKGIVVVVPSSMTAKRMAKLIPEFVKDKQNWLNEALEKLRARGKITPGIEQCQLPKEIALVALDELFSISYYSSIGAEGLFCNAEGSFPSAKGSITLQQVNDYHLEVRGDLSNKVQIFKLLETFFKKYARFYLEQRLDELSNEFCLPYNRLTVRAQKTRWGSCSSKKNINLNYRLLFIEKELVDYILLHELVHTVHMNHSKSFWFYFESLMSDAHSRDKQVNQMTKILPCWIFYSQNKRV